MRRVVVTGMGIVSSLGNNVAEVKDSLYKAAQALHSNQSMLRWVCARMWLDRLRTSM